MKNMSPEDFLKAYEAALRSQDWKKVEPLIAEQACVTFSNGTVHKGKSNVQRAFENNFNLIKSEKYQMSQISWLQKNMSYAVYLFDYDWSGLIGGKLISGTGIGTSIIIKEEGSCRSSNGRKWLL